MGLTAGEPQLRVNNFSHTVALRGRHRGHDPGLVTTIFVQMPYRTLVIAYIVMENILRPRRRGVGRQRKGSALPAELAAH